MLQARTKQELAPAVRAALGKGRRPKASLREAQRYFDRYQRRPISLPKLRFMEAKP